jgi:hypothetical protein
LFNTVDKGSAAPPEGVKYHKIPLPAAVSCANVAVLQNDWLAGADGAAGVVTKTCTANRELDSQLETV